MSQSRICQNNQINTQVGLYEYIPGEVSFFREISFTFTATSPEIPNNLNADSEKETFSGDSEIPCFSSAKIGTIGAIEKHISDCNPLRNGS